MAKKIVIQSRKNLIRDLEANLDNLQLRYDLICVNALKRERLRRKSQ